jgi:putative transposase
MDATDNELLETQYYGCCVVDLYNRARPHTSLGPGIPDIPLDRLAQPTGHQLPDAPRVIATPILGGLHHEYRLQPIAA